MFFDVINVSELTLEFDQKISDCDCNHIPELIFRILLQGSVLLIFVFNGFKVEYCIIS